MSGEKIGALPRFELIDEFTAPVGDSLKPVKQFELRCPRKDCRGTITVPRADLTVSRFLSRPCVHCFRTALLPVPVQNYVRKYGPQSVPGPPVTARRSKAERLARGRSKQRK